MWKYKLEFLYEKVELKGEIKHRAIDQMSSAGWCEVLTNRKLKRRLTMVDSFNSPE